jgi:hypothetical protein
MKEFKGTKGEWKAELRKSVWSVAQKGYDYNFNDLQKDSPNENLSTVCGIWGASKKDEANAHLIAAAPQMLDVLQKTRLDLKCLGLRDDSPMIRDIDNVINKALNL